MGDFERGKKIFMSVCASCHTYEEGAPHRVGPNLYGVIGRKAGTAKGYKFSCALRKKGVTWDQETLDQLWQNPQKYVPGTKETFEGIPKAEDRANVYAFLEEVTQPPDPKKKKKKK